MRNTKVNCKNKISPQFAARLDHLGSKQKVRAFIIVCDEKINSLATGRSPEHRQETMNSMSTYIEQTLPYIDRILNRFGGQRLAKPDALGSIPIEATASGIRALTASKKVKAIFEDQKISLVS